MGRRLAGSSSLPPHLHGLDALSWPAHRRVLLWSRVVQYPQGAVRNEQAKASFIELQAAQFHAMNSSQLRFMCMDLPLGFVDADEIRVAGPCFCRGPGLAPIGVDGLGSGAYWATSRRIGGQAKREASAVGTLHR